MILQTGHPAAPSIPGASVSRFTDLRTFFDELKRRHVVRAATAYAVGAFVVLEGASLVFEGLLVPGWVFQVLTVLAVGGFPIALVIAWLYEWTASGLTIDPAEGRHGPASPRVRLYAFTGLGIVIALVTLGLSLPYVYASRAAGSSAEAMAPLGSDGAMRTVAAAELRSELIAVLPFAPLTTGAADAGFSDGLTEDVITALAQSEGLDVVSRTTSMAYAGTEKATPVIAAELGAGLILEGTIRRIGDRVRVTAQLIDTRTDTHLWAESYDRELKDVFAVQSELAYTIVAAVQAAIPQSSGEAQRVYAAHMQYRSGVELLERESPRRIRAEGAAEAFKQAIETNPKLAAAHAGLAEALMLQAVDGQPQLIDTAALHAERAVQLDPRLPDGRAARAIVLLAKGETERARSELATAIELARTDSATVASWRYRFEDLAEPMTDVRILVEELPETPSEAP